MLLHPIVTGEPVLTAQAFYYLDELENVAKIRFENRGEEISANEIEYLVDNYLFEFSRVHSDQNAHSKPDRFKLLSDEPSGFYIDVDNRNTQSLVIDAANDPDVQYLRPAEVSDDLNLDDWDIGRSNIRDSLNSYMNSLSEKLNMKVSTCIHPSNGRDGYVGRLRAIKPGDGLLDFFQAMSLEDISIRSVGPTMASFPLGQSFTDHSEDALPVEHIIATRRYNPVLLSHYFSGLKEANPLKAFVGFYNVLEYFFGEVPSQSTADFLSEKVALKQLIKHLFSDQEICDLVQQSHKDDLAQISKDLLTSSSVSIQALSIADNASEDIARWLYEIRCAVVHSKKSRNGQPTASFEPYSDASDLLRSVVPVIRRIADKVISIEGTVL